MLNLLFNNQNPIDICEFIGETCVVQDYPQVYKTVQKRRVEDSTWYEARSKGFIYGIRTSNHPNHWTRLIQVKPSERLQKVWNESQYGGHKILDITFNQVANKNVYLVKACYMDGIGKVCIGYVSAEQVEALKAKAWEVELLQSVA